MRLVYFVYDNNRRIIHSLKQPEQVKISVEQRNAYLGTPHRQGLVRKLQSDPPDTAHCGACEATAQFTASFLDDLFPTCSRQRFAVLRAAGAGSCQAMASYI